VTLPDDRPLGLDRLRRLVAGEIASYRLEKRYVRKDGGIVWAQLTVSAVRTPEDGAGPLYEVAVIEDVTERKRIDEELAARTAEVEELAHALELAPVLVRDLDGTIRRWNEGSRALYGWSAAEAVGRVSHELLATEFPEPLAAIDERLLRQGIWSGELIHRRKDGERLVVASLWTLRRGEPGGAPDTVVEVNTDVTARRRAEAALRESEARFRMMADSIPQLAWMAQADGWIYWYNRRWYDFTGTTLEEMEGWGWRRVHHPEHIDRVVERFRRSLASGEPWEDTFPLRGRDGGYRWFLSRALPVRDAEGRVAMWFGTNTDITERLEAEAEVRRLSATLERRVEERTRQLAEANQELQDFAYSVSHDLRAPLRTMQGFSRALLEDCADGLDEIGRDYARRIIAGATRLDELIRDLLAYSRVTREEIELRPVSLDKTADDVLAQLRGPIAEAGASVEAARPLGSMLGHPAILTQALSNLVGNALKFVPAGIPPRVAIRSESRDGGRRLRLWVEDNGIGIAPEHRERIFQVFQRLHGVAEYAGTGIGLAIVRKGIERLGGAVGVESETGVGSRFWIELAKGDG
jgi:PAS domain S-box-containing protein